MDLANAKAVITGGASGLGFATAERVIAAGGKVVLLDVNDEQGAASVAKLGEQVVVRQHRCVKRGRCKSSDQDGQ